jgi:hypothetical protein
MYAVVRNYTDEASDVVEQLKQREASVMAMIQGIEGFVSYYVLDTGNGGLATISVYETRAGAEESVRSAAKWVQENMADSIPNPPTVIQGEIALHASR